MSPSTPSVRTDDDKLIVEAPTAEAALELVAERLGTRARIAGVERVRRGGVGGFFAREMVQVTATGAGGTGATTPPRVEVSAPTAGASDTSADGPVDRLLRELANRDDPFASTLHDQLSPQAQPAGAPPPRDERPRTPPAAVDAGRPGAAPAQLLPATRGQAARPLPPRRAAVGHEDRRVVEATPEAASEAVAGTPQWSVRNLCRLGLPPLLSAGQVAALAAADDIAWTHALADSLRPLCRSLPTGPTIVVGPTAERLAGTLELAIHWPGQPTPPESFVAPITGRYSERDWLAQVRGQRHLHLVVGGPAWRGLLFDEPVVLSHDDASMCETVSLAFHLDIGLGYTCHASGRVTRANPVDLAMAVRRLLPVHP